MKKLKFLLLLFTIPLLFSCSSSGLSEDELNDLIDKHNAQSLVEVVINFTYPIPSEVVEIDIWMDSCALGDGSRVDYLDRRITKDNFTSTMTFILSSKPEYYGQPITQGKYMLGLNRSDGYYYTTSNEFKLSELVKYSKLEYDFEGIGPPKTDNYYDRGTGKLKLKSSKLR